MKKINYETGNGFTGHYLGLRSGPIPLSTGNSKISIPDFRFHTHPRRASQHAPANANAYGYTNTAIATLTDEPDMDSQVNTQA